MQLFLADCQFPDIENILYEWGWHRAPIDRINLTGNVISVGWLFFDYYGINMMMIQPMGKEYEDYFEGDGEEELEFIEYLKNKLDILEGNGFIERYEIKKLI